MTDNSCVCTVEVSPDEVDAGAELTLRVRVEGARKDSLRRPRVSIRDRDGAELARADLTKSDDGYESGDIIVAAPRAVGEFVHRAVVLAAGKDGVVQEQASAEIRFAVTAHAAELNVWDVPSAIVAGERFEFIVGLRCSAGCNLGGQRLGVLDRDGVQVSAVALAADAWPGTDALYCARVEATAPAALGAHAWEVRTAEWSSELPHAAGSVALALRVVPQPDCEVTVEVVDREKRTPIEGATVVMHPYRTVTGASGIAKLEVTKGPYDILVSGPQNAPVCIATDVTADMVTRAELDEDPPVESPDD